jgi:hypothetical protein
MASRPELDKYKWQKRRAAVMKRDGNRCVFCGSSEKLSVHHKVKAKHGGTDHPDNLVTLCGRCHRLADRRKPFPLNGGLVKLENDPHPIASVDKYPRADFERKASEAVDDPESGIYWGPPDENGVCRRWSRAWFD